MPGEAKDEGILFDKAAKSYLHALAAIAALEGEVNSLCEDVYGRYKGDLIKSMGLKEQEADPYSEKELDPTWAGLGVERRSSEARLWIYLCWESEPEETLSAVIELEVAELMIRDKIFAQLEGVPELDGVYTWRPRGIGIKEQIKELSAATAKETLESLVAKWVKGCQAMGGLQLNQS